MSVLLDGLIHIHGEVSAGKTSFALTASNEPEKVVFLDGDAGKGREMANEIGIEKYYDLTDTLGDLDELKYHQRVLALIEGLDTGWDVIVFDNPVNFFRGAHSYVDANRDQFRANWSPSGKYAAMQVYTEMRKKHLPSVYAKLQRKAKLVIIITHEQDDYDDAGVKTGAKVAEADESLTTAAGMVIRMTRDTRGGKFAPVGLLIKKYRPQFDPKARRVVNIFPDRLDPCDWDTIESYLKEPVGLKDELEEHEIPDEFETNLIRGSLTEEQQKTYDFYRQMELSDRMERIEQEAIALASESNAPRPVMLRQVSSRLKERYQSAAPSPEGVGMILDRNEDSQNENSE